MKKLLAAATLSIALVAPLPAFAQSSDGGAAGAAAGATETPSSGTTESGAGGQTGGDDASNYLAGPNIQAFFADNSSTTLRSDAEMRAIYGGMSQADQQSLKQACLGNSDARFSELCRSVGTW